MSTGFDVYALQCSTPSHSFKVLVGRRYTRGVVFGEKGAVIVGGSDCGKVYVFDVKSLTLAQLITHGKPSSNNRDLIISGSSDDDSSICIWQKLVRWFNR